jgi:putative flippase GtrA
MTSQVANALSLVLATLGTAANRAWTFGVTGRERMMTDHGQALLVFAITWLATSLALWVLAELAPHAGTGAQTLVVATANAVSTVVRFIAMRGWIFKRGAA